MTSFNPKSTLLLNHVAADEASGGFSVRIMIVHSKTDNSGVDLHVTVLPRTGARFCPVRALLEYLPCLWDVQVFIHYFLEACKYFFHLFIHVFLTELQLFIKELQLFIQLFLICHPSIS